MEYKLQRSKRKTLTISIVNGEVTVKAPVRLPLEHIERFVAQKSAWIEKKLAEYSRKTDVLSSVIDGSSAMYHGEFFPIERSERHKRITLSDGALHMPVKYATRAEQDRALAAWYKRVATVELSTALRKMSDITGLRYGDFALTNARTKWGSCDGNGNIRLNWRLIMLDAESVEYVLVHELSHTEHHDHSAAFWAEVKKHIPNYAAEKKRLKTFSVLTSLYR